MDAHLTESGDEAEEVSAHGLKSGDIGSENDRRLPGRRVFFTSRATACAVQVVQPDRQHEAEDPPGVADGGDGERIGDAVAKLHEAVATQRRAGDKADRARPRPRLVVGKEEGGEGRVGQLVEEAVEEVGREEGGPRPSPVLGGGGKGGRRHGRDVGKVAADAAAGE